MFGNLQFTVCMIIISLFFSSPIFPVGGAPLFLPSSSRPNVFWNDSSECYQSSGDSLFYEVLNTSIAENLSNYIKIGKIPHDQIFFICDDYLNAIVHLISNGNDYFTFQLRGLEAQEQTLCHRNELDILRRGLDDLIIRRVFVISSIYTTLTDPPLKLLDKIFTLLGLPGVLTREQRSFVRSATWSEWRDDVSFESYSVTSIRIDQMFPDRATQSLLLKAVGLLTALFYPEVEVPEGVQIHPLFDPNLLDQLGGWINSHHQEHNFELILKLASLHFFEMSKTNGDFSWQLFHYFSSVKKRLSHYTWLSDEDKALMEKIFRISLSVGIHDIVGLLPDGSIDETTKWIAERFSENRFINETEPEFANLVHQKAKYIETLRRSVDEGGIVIKYFCFTLKEKPFKIVSLNPEAVRGLWAGQISEIGFLQFTDKERGGIQFDQYTLRNLITQSANSPVGYPQIVCPFTTSFTDLSLL